MQYMKRRKFIKDIGLCACVCSTLLAGCGRGNIFKSSDNNLWVDRVEIPICYHCNLNCARCDHYAPLAPKYEMPISVFKKDLERFSKITNQHLKELVLFGGEPLLHNNIEELVQIADNCFPNSEKYVLTNGLLLNDMKESFWQTLGKFNMGIRYSNYYLYEKYPKDFNKAYENAQKYNVKLSEWGKCGEFNKVNISSTPKYELLDSYEKCGDKVHCSTLDNGLLYPCAMCSSVKFFNNYFKENQIPVHEKDSLNIYKISSIEEILDFYSKPKPICAYCGYWKDVERFEWTVSKRDINEWYKA